MDRFCQVRCSPLHLILCINSSYLECVRRKNLVRYFRKVFAIGTWPIVVMIFANFVQPNTSHPVVVSTTITQIHSSPLSMPLELIQGDV